MLHPIVSIAKVYLQSVLKLVHGVALSCLAVHEQRARLREVATAAKVPPAQQ